MSEMTPIGQMFKRAADLSRGINPDYRAPAPAAGSLVQTPVSADSIPGTTAEIERTRRRRRAPSSVAILGGGSDIGDDTFGG